MSKIVKAVEISKIDWVKFQKPPKKVLLIFKKHFYKNSKVSEFPKTFYHDNFIKKCLLSLAVLRRRLSNRI